MTQRLVATIIALLALTVPAGAAQYGNLDVFRDVQKQVLRYPHFTIFDGVSANVDNGVVTLTGNVTMPYKREDIERRVARLAGVTRVDNQIAVLPVSQFDDDLRLRIARSIYGNANFWHYASMANPPIHIIVRGGHVVLEGVVGSNIDRMLARSLASQFGVFSLQNDLMTDAEAKAQLESL
jgi:hyperosmotically inducible periplasmic protein